MGYGTKLLGKVKTFAKNVEKKQLKSRQRKYKYNQLKLEELKLEAKIEAQKAKIAKSKQSTTKASQKNYGSLTDSLMSGERKKDANPVNPFGGALGMYKK